MTDKVTSEISGGVLRLTMNRPEKKNALTQDMYSALADALESVSKNRQVRVVHITGAGDAFTSGNDVADFVAQNVAEGDPPVFRFLRSVASAEVPVVAAVNGLAVGIGVTMLLHFDFVYASPEAVFKTPFVDLALVPEAASSLLMPAQMGYRDAARMLLLGEQFDAERALASGLISELVDADSLQEKSLAIAAALAKKPPAALRTSKRLLRQDYEPVAERMEREFAEFAAVLQSPEAAEAMTAFFEKREPDFSQFD